MKDKKAITLKNLNKSNVWELQENDAFRLWEMAEKDVDVKDNIKKYVDILKSAFLIEPVKLDRPEVIAKMEERGFQVGLIKLDETGKQKVGLKKKPILRVTDLSYENIRHISAAKLVEVLERNFGGGWDSLSQSAKDIIQHGFEVSTTTLPKERLHKEGGLYQKKVDDGYEVLEIAKGTWTEAIFVKEKPELTLPKLTTDDFDDDDFKHKLLSDDEDEDNEDYIDEDEDNVMEEEDDDYDEDEMTEESYRTTYDTDTDDLDLESAEMVEDDDY